MRFDKLTLKSQEIIQDSQQLAEKLGNQQIEPEHLVRIILEQMEGVVPPILGKIGADRDQLVRKIDIAIERIPKVSGSGTGQIFMSPRTKTVLEQAFKEAEKMKDEYVGIEHILIGILEEKGGEAGKILSASGITRDNLLKALAKDNRPESGGQISGPGTVQSGSDGCRLERRSGPGDRPR
jgi:ATP-dependent Clp protease ATP-binding subunit ClpB